MAQLLSGTTIGGRNIVQEFDTHNTDNTKHLSIMTTSGDMIYQGSTSPVRLPKGTDGQVLSLVSGLPQWKTIFTIGNTAPSSPNVNDLWIDTSM